MDAFTNDRSRVKDQTLLGTGKKSHIKRRPFRAIARVTPLNRDYRSFDARALELNHQGLFIRTRYSMDLDSILFLELDFPTLPIENIKLHVVVIHRIPGAGLGCRFIEVDSNTRRILSQIVSYSVAAPLALRKSNSKHQQR